MSKHTPSIRDIAKTVGLSKATVANALNGSPTVAEPTVRKVLAAAVAMGYQRNPMVGAFMSALRRSQRPDFQGVLALVEFLEPDRPPHGPFHRALVEGCANAAAELGLKVEPFKLSSAASSSRRLNSILQARGIRGVIILPAWQTPEIQRLDWSFLTGIYTDYIRERPVLNTVCCDHYRSTLELLQQVYQRGYRRPGLYLEAGRDDRVHFRTLAALRTFQDLHPTPSPIPPLVAPKLERRTFVHWLRREQPDVVLSHNTGDLDWISSCGLRVPQDIGYVALNITKAKHACAALDLQAHQIGRCAVETLLSQIQRQAWGLPRFPTTTMVIGELVDGPTLLRALPQQKAL